MDSRNDVYSTMLFESACFHYLLSSNCREEDFDGYEYWLIEFQVQLMTG